VTKSDPFVRTPTTRSSGESDRQISFIRRGNTHLSDAETTDGTGSGQGFVVGAVSQADRTTRQTKQMTDGNEDTADQEETAAPVGERDMPPDDDPPVERLERALSVLVAARDVEDDRSDADSDTDHDWRSDDTRADTMSREAAARTVAAVADTRSEFIAEYADAVCEGFLSSLTVDDRTVVEESVPTRVQADRDVARSLAGAVGSVAKHRPTLSTVGDAVAAGVDCGDDEVRKAALEATDPIVEAGNEETLSTVAGALVDALDLPDGELQPITAHLHAVTEQSPGVVAPHVDRIATAVGDEITQIPPGITATLQALGREHPESLVDHVDRLARTLAHVTLTPPDAHRTLAYVTGALGNVAHEKPGPVAAHVDALVTFVERVEDAALKRNGLAVLHSVTEERPEAVAEAPDGVEVVAECVQAAGSSTDGEPVENAEMRVEALGVLANVVAERPSAVVPAVEPVAAVVATSTDRATQTAAVSVLAPLAVAEPAVVAPHAGALARALPAIPEEAVGSGVRALGKLAQTDPEAVSPAVGELAAVAERTADTSVATDALVSLMLVADEQSAAVVPEIETLVAILTDADADSTLVNALGVLVRVAGDEPGAVADHLECVLSGARQGPKTAVSRAAAVVAAVAETHPQRVADCAAAVGELAERASEPEPAGNALAGLATLATVEDGDVTPAADGVAAAMATHHSESVQTNGLTVLLAVGQTAPELVVDHVDIVAEAIGAVDRPSAVASGLEILLDVATRDPEAVVDHVDGAVAVAREHTDDIVVQSCTALLATFAEANSELVADYTDVLVEALGGPATVNALLAFRVLVRSRPADVVPHVPAIERTLLSDGVDADPTATKTGVEVFVDAGAARSTDPVALGRVAGVALQQTEDRSKVLHRALSTASLRASGSRQVVLAMFRTLLDAELDDEALLRIVQAWAGLLRRSADDDSLSARAQRVSTTARERADALSPARATNAGADPTPTDDADDSGEPRRQGDEAEADPGSTEPDDASENTRGARL
jgi:hypothetical protein